MTDKPKAADVPAVLSPGAHGLDVSRWQKDVDWQRVKASGASFAYIKASESGGVDPAFAANWSGSRQAGLPRGAYHYFRVEVDPCCQAGILAALGRDGELPVALDVEKQRTAVSESVFTARLSACLAELERLTGRKPVIYTGKYVWEALTGASTEWSKYPLWIASYPLSHRAPSPAELEKITPRLPQDWERWAFWQYSSNGRVDGIDADVDLNLYSGEAL